VRRRGFFVGVALLVIAVAGCSGGSDKADGLEETASLRILAGTVEVQPPSADFSIAVDGQALEEGFTIRTAADGRAVIEYFDGSVTRLDQNTTFTIVTLRILDNEDQSKVIEGEQTSGNTYSRVTELTDSASRFDVSTPTATASVQGTVYAILVGPDGSTTIAVIDGSVGVLNTGSEVSVPTGFMVVLGADGTLSELLPIPDDLLNSDWIVFNQCELDDEGNCPVAVGPLASIEVSPETAAVDPAQPQPYAAEGFDADGHSLGAVNAAFEIVDGTCAGSVCSSQIPGDHVVTGSFGGSSDTATLTVGGIDELTVTLSWQGAGDLDLWVTDPSGETVKYDHASASGGHLLSDANKDCEAAAAAPPEVVTWSPGTALPGGYTITVDYWTECGAGAVEFSLTVEIGSELVLSTTGTMASPDATYSIGFFAAEGAS